MWICEYVPFQSELINTVPINAVIFLIFTHLVSLSFFAATNYDKTGLTSISFTILSEPEILRHISKLHPLATLPKSSEQDG